MATVSVTTSPTTLDSGGSGFLRVTNTGNVQVLVTRGSDVTVLWPNCTTVITPAGTAVTAATVSGTSTLDTGTGVNDIGFGGAPVAFDDLSADALAGLSRTFARLGLFDVRNFGAKVDGVRLTDVAITSGTTALSSPGGGFAAATAGMVIAVHGAGVGGADLVATITPVSATAATASAAASTTVTAAVATYGTDDTAAIQAAIQAAFAAGSGTVWQPAGISMVGAVQTTGTVAGTKPYTYSGQVLIPANPILSAPRTVRILGPVPVPQTFWGMIVNDLMPPEAAGVAVWRSTAASGKVVDCIPDVVPSAWSTDATWTNTNVHIENLVLRLPVNSQATGLDFNKAIGAKVINSTVGPDYNGTSQVGTPTGTAYGIRLPTRGNGTVAEIRSSQVYGLPTGVWHSEHAILDNLSVAQCLVGIEPWSADHLSLYSRVLLQWNRIHIQPTGGGSYICGEVDFESAGSVPGNRYDIEDPSSLLIGRLGYHRHSSAGRTRIAVRGPAAGITLHRLDTDTPNVRAANAAATSDSFAGQDNNYVIGQADTGQAWTMPRGAGTWGLDTGKAKCLDAGNRSIAFLTPHNRTTSQTVQVDVRLSATSNRACSGLAIAATGPSDYIGIGFEKDTYTPAGSWFIAKYVGGVETTLTSGATTLVNGSTYQMKVVRTATTIQVFKDGVSLATHTLSAGDQTAFNGAFGAGIVCWAVSGSDDLGSRWDSFSVV